MKIKSNFKKLSSLISLPLEVRQRRTKWGHLSSRRGFIHAPSFRKSGAGFTLIELLIVIAILGVLAAGILVAIDPIDKINAANDSKVQNDVSAIGRALEAYAAVHNGKYPLVGSGQDLAELVTAGELKRLPKAPAGYYDYAFGHDGCSLYPSSCTDETQYTDRVIDGQLKSKKFTSAGTSHWTYQTVSGKSCATNGKTNC